MPRRALVTGASIAGLSTAFWLARTGWDVELVERAPAFRDGGQNVDVRGAAHEVVERMGLTEAVRARHTTERGTAFIDGRGGVLGGIPADAAEDGPTAELEILRGDLAQIVLDALPDAVTVRWGDSVTEVARAGEDAVRVVFEQGGSGSYDLLVVAEGVGSRTRRLVFGDVVDERDIGLHMAYGTIPRIAGDDDWWRWYAAPGRRGITLRPDAVGTIRATLAYVDHEHRLADLPADEALLRLRVRFADAGWQAERVTEGFLRSEDVYVDSLTQIRMPSWSAGRVVVTGDAAWCVTPLGGGGTSLALTGGYVLAAELSADGGVDRGLAAYERWMRPVVDAVQQLPPGTPDLFYPSSRAGVEVMRTLERLLTTRPLRRVAARFSQVAGTDQPLPEVRSSPATA